MSTAPAVPANPCAEMECENGGVCLVGVGGAGSCSCPEGTAGHRCQLITAVPPTSPCDDVPCGPGQR